MAFPARSSECFHTSSQKNTVVRVNCSKIPRSNVNLCPRLISIVVILKMLTKSNLGRGVFVWLTHSDHSWPVRDSTQVRAEAGTRKECCSLACSQAQIQLPSLYLSGPPPFKAGSSHINQQCHTDMPTSQSRGNSSAEVPSSRDSDTFLSVSHWQNLMSTQI